MNKKRLLKMADFLDKLPKEKFNFSTFVSQGNETCGTVCCAVGWMPKIFGKKSPVKWISLGTLGQINTITGTWDDSWEVREFLGISYSDFEYLFIPRYFTNQRKRLSINTTAKRVAARIRKFVENGVK